MKRFIVGFIPLSFMVGLPTIAGRMACVLAAALLACASSAHSQVIEESGFPVKGGGVSGESFSLSCPPRLYVEAGGSVLFSCSATAVPEEGVRYEWKSLSGDGLHLLSDANERSPLFTAPVSEAGAEYVYRLTAMSVGVYETATVTVMAHDVSGGSLQDGSKSPESPEACDSFGALEGFREGCVAGDKMPPSFEPFGGGPEGEGGPGLLFPEAPVLPDRPSGPVRGGGSGRQAPPRLECPVAVFLEELETGQIECHAWDASGEEFLEYSWEPVGSTTRDYLNNPRLIPEDAPNPSVVAPEAPVYETLESFHSGETTFRYRYRLTATSRATGLSSSSEVGVYVSSSRPSVYCPLEIVVEEGSTAALDCEGVDPLSHRMDYDEDGASIEWEWEGLWGTSTAHLDETDLSSPLFTAPVGSAGEEYHYIASMTSSASGAPRTARRRVTVRVTEAEEGEQTAVKVTAQNVTEGASGMPGQVECFVIANNVYEGDPDRRFRCRIVVTGDDQLLSVTWTWEDPYDPGMLSATNIRNPIFYVPESVSATTRFDFQVTAKYQLVSGYKIETLNIYAIVNNLEVVVACDDPGNVEEGDADITFSCSATYPLSGTLRWSWSPTTRLTGHNTGTPRFDVPDDVDGDKTYTYAVRVTADRADPGGETVKVKVRNADTTAPAVRCTNASIYEGSRDITLSCSVTNEPAGATYGWAGADIANRLTGTDGLAPTFAAPDDINEPGGANKDYEYTVTLTAGGVDVATEDVTVTVLEKPDITWCGVKQYTSSYTIVWEGYSVETNAWYCAESPQGAPGHNPAYMFWWSTLGDTPATAINLLQPRDVRDPIFSIPPHGTVDEDQTYEFRATISAANADDATWDWRVIVKNSKVTVTCDDPAPVDEGDMDFDFACFAIGPPGLPDYTWSWSPTDGLTDHNTATPTFDVPDNVDQDTTYTYTVTVMEDDGDDGTATVTVTVRDTDSTDPSLTCTDSEVYEGSSDITLDCSVTNEPSGATYAWTARSRRAGTSLLSSTSILKPTFDVPDNVDADTDYEYTVTMSASGLDDVSEDIIVTVKNRPPITVDCDGVYGLTYQGNFELYEGDPDKVLNCRATGAPVGSVYAWSWSPIDRLTDHHTATPTFAVPDAVDRYTVYTYTVTATAANAEDGVADVIVRVYDTDSTDPSLTCTDSEVYEGSSDITLDCSVTNEPSGATYAWTARSRRAGTSLLSSTSILKPTFDVPDNVDADTDYEYTVTVSADNAEDATADVTVTVLNKKALNVACATPSPVYEGSADLALDCSASGAPAGSTYEYVWTARGSTANTDELSAVDISSPTFYVPDEVDETTTYEYLLTASAENAESGSAEVTVTVLNAGALHVVCASPASVYEGSADFSLDCTASGAPAGSEYAYVWTAQGDTENTLQLSATDISSPTFYVPDEVDETTTYEYLLTASAENAESGSAAVTVMVLNAGALRVVCASPASVYEGSADFALDCSASGAPSGSAYEYAWTARGSTQNTLQLSATDIPSPTFYVPDAVDVTTDYEYLLTASAENAEDASAEVVVTVLNRSALSVVCADPGSVYEGSEDITLDCTASGAPAGPEYAYVWMAQDDTENTLQLSATDIPSPTFYVPDAVDVTTDYEYLLTVSADNAEDASAEVMVTVLNKGALAVVCTAPGSVYEGSEDIAFDCEASGAPGDRPQYAYAWTARGDTQDMSLLSAVDMASPTFYVPDEVSEDETYEYLLTVSADNAEDASAEVMVTVLNKGALAVVCTDPGSVYEGSEDIAFDCEASGAPGDRPQYAYAWTARGDTQDMSLLSAVDMASPTFSVPDAVDVTTDYEYLLTVSAANAEDASAEVTVTVLNKEALALACADPGSVYEGSEDIAFDCAASGAPEGSDYAYAWTARGDTQDMSLLSAVDMASPTFSVPDAVDVTTDYEYLLTVSAANAEDASAEVMVTVLNKGALAVVCTDPGSVYEGSEDIAFDCEAFGAPGDRPQYAYAWTARGDTQDMSLLSAVDMASPTFYVPDEVSEDETYEYLLTVSADNAEDASAEVMVTVLNKGALAVVCTDPGSVYEGSEDIAFDCEASGAPGDRPQYAYAWTARGDTQDMSLLSAVDMASPTFYVPDEVSEDETYEYLLTVSAANAEDASAEVTVTVLNKEALALACADPGSVYEGSEDIAFDCAASGAPEGSDYAYAWTARGDTQDMSLLSAVDMASPTFYVPDEVSEDETYEYLLTVSAANAEDAAAEVTVTVLNKEALALSCADPGSVYEGSEDFSFDCTASGALGDDPVYTYAWTARGDTQDTSLLSATDIASPTFHVPAEVDEDETYEYLLTVSAANAEDAAAEVTVTVLDRVQTPPSDPVSRPLASSSAPESAQPSSLGVTVSASSLRFGVQSAETQASLDPMTDQLSTRVSGPYHAGRMTLSPDGGEALDKNGEMALSIELASPVVLRLEGGVDAASIVLSPSWSFAESCEQLSSQAIGGLYTETTLSEDACRLLRFGGELDLTDVLPGHYAGSLDVVLRSGEREETHSVEVDVTVVPAQRVITIGPGGVRFSTSRELSAGLSEEQNLSIYPDVAFLTREKPHGAFELSNPSLIPLEVTVSTRFGYTEATENGREVVVEEASESHLGDLSQVVGIHPGILVLQPGEKGLVRYGMQEGALAAMTEKGYAAFFDVMSEPRQYVRTDRMPEEVTGDRTARVTMRVPGVYVPAEGASQLRAALLSISFVGPMSATFLLETQDHPFAGEVVAYDGEGRELGRRETLVYTRSRVRIPLDRMPEEGAVFLRFSPRGSGRVPEPASVEWDAPRRDIGEAQKKEKTPTTATVAGRGGVLKTV